MVSVLHDGRMKWQELAAIHRAGGERYTRDFINGAIFGDPRSAARVNNLIGEFQIITPGDDTAMPLIELAGSADEESPIPAGLEDALDQIFFEQFWEHVNPQLPDPLTKQNEE
jgi:hypothetical protein